MSERTTLHDEDVMPWGKWAGTPLGNVPDHYWRWFLDQAWCDQWPKLVEYANHCVEDE